MQQRAPKADVTRAVTNRERSESGGRRERSTLVKMSTFYVCNKTESLQSKQCVKLHVNEAMLSVSSLYALIAKRLNLDYDENAPSFHLICFGKILKPEKQLSNYGIRNGTVIYVLKKFVDEEKLKKEARDETGKKPKLDQTEINRMVIALRTALIIPSFRNMLDKLHEKEFRENLMACTPALRNDPIAFAILQDADLLTLLTDPDNIQKVLEKHPSISEAAMHLAAAFHEDAIATPMNATSESSSANALFTLPSSNAYSLDDLSDDDEDLGGGVDAAPPDGQQVMSPRTAQTFQQLMQQAMLTSSRSASSSIGTPAATTPQSQSVITAEMLRQAIESSQPSTSGISSNMSTSNEVVGETRVDWSEQIRQLNDLGIHDDALIIQALEASNGDVQAAINIIFGDNFNS
ncbi:ubiquitin-like protein 7 [Dinothrombium tinctorium]|uniref:Ubiquitin-like protein 7 n=1 Tax=Dinothrombium tinctorium TaxID=1965070 RepID=A0A3S3Q4B7_9ACAR|nr:ubiquitin-like protein 7 [Dinothrombium tinctorium]